MHRRHHASGYAKSVLPIVAAALALCVAIAQPAAAGPYWPAMPTDAQINQAAQAFLSSISNRSVHDWSAFKYHDPQEGDPVSANGVGLAYRVNNPDYDPSNSGQPDLECDVATLWYYNDWQFVVGGGRLMCFSSTDTLDALTQQFLSHGYAAGWVGGGENTPPTVTLTY